MMSIIALGIVIIHFAIFGITNETDEGTAAHIFQLFMVIQVPVVIFFLIRYLGKTPKQVLEVLALQIFAAIAACTSVFFLT